MSAVLEPRTLDRLTTLCDMFGSAQVRASSTTWFDMTLPLRAPVEWRSDDSLAEIERDIRYAMLYLGWRNDWECGFMEDMDRRPFRGRLSAKQISKTRAAVAKIRARIGGRP
jgi:hypothetical protein